MFRRKREAGIPSVKGRGSSLLRWSATGARAATVALIMAVPLGLSNRYYLTIGTTICMFAVLALAARLLLLGGMWSFGQAAFATVGAYTYALIIMRAGLSPWVALALSGAASGLIGTLAGFLILRATAIHFAILTMTLVFLVSQIIVLTPDFTGGAAGLAGIPSLSPIHISGVTMSFESQVSLYYVGAALLVATLLFMWSFDKSRFAQVLSAAASHEALAAAVGINVRAYRVVAFGIASFFTGLAGGFSAIFLSFVGPSVWSLFPSIFVVAYAIIGGLATVGGPVVGTTVVIIVQNLLSATEGLQLLLLGLILMGVMIVLPGGFVGGMQEARRLLGKATRVRRRPRAPRGIGEDPMKSGTIQELSHLEGDHGSEKLT